MLIASQALNAMAPLTVLFQYSLQIGQRWFEGSLQLPGRIDDDHSRAIERTALIGRALGQLYAQHFADPAFYYCIVQACYQALALYRIPDGVDAGRPAFPCSRDTLHQSLIFVT